MSSNTRATDQLLGSLQADEGKGIVSMEDRVDARPTCGRRSPIPIVSPAGSARWRVTCARR
jgi:hypothetical protein